MGPRRRTSSRSRASSLLKSRMCPSIRFDESARTSGLSASASARVAAIGFSSRTAFPPPGWSACTAHVRCGARRHDPGFRVRFRDGPLDPIPASDRGPRLEPVGARIDHPHQFGLHQSGQRPGVQRPEAAQPHHADLHRLEPRLHRLPSRHAPTIQHGTTRIPILLAPIRPRHVRPWNARRHSQPIAQPQLARCLDVAAERRGSSG